MKILFSLVLLFSCPPLFLLYVLLTKPHKKAHDS